MPPTRRQLARDEKVEEIVAVAVAQLREGGFSALSVAEVARRLGLAQAAVYWYFPSRDHLFVAALQRMVHETIAVKPPHDAPLQRHVLWWTDVLAELSAFRAAVRERARQSEIVAAFEAAGYKALEDVLAATIKERSRARDAAQVARVIVATVDGLLLRNLPKRDRDAAISLAVRRLLPEVGATRPAPSR